MTSKLILGTVQFGLDYGVNNKQGQVSEENINKILDYAFEKGVRILDTAEAYGNSQEIIGNYHRKSNNKFEVVTKFHTTSILDENFSVKDRVLEDLKILSVESLYSYMFHSFSDYKKYYHFFKDELLELKLKGIIKKIGVSVYTNEELINVIKNKNISLIQLPFNLLDNHSLRSEPILIAKKKGVEIHSRSAFLQGLFFKPLETITGNLTGLKTDLKKINIQTKNKNIDIATLALNYPIQKDYINKVLIGVDSLAQLKQNINCLNTSSNLNSLFSDMDTITIKNKELLNPSLWKM